MAGFKNSEVDIGYLGAPPAILKRLNEGTGTTIVAQANMEGSALVVSEDSDVNSLHDLVGKTVATPGESSIQHLLLKIALSREGISFLKG
jgi:NitT/TauT family transport system substrate-binding protein